MRHPFRPIRSAVLICTFLLQHPCLFAADSGTDLLAKGWEEYQFLSLGQAESHFRAALKQGLSPEKHMEALLGLAMSLQYPEGGRNLSKAEDIYHELLDLEPVGEIRDLVLSNLADLHLARGENQEALRLLDTLVHSSLDSVIGQEALRRRIHLQVGPYGSEQSREIAEEASALLWQLEGSRDDPKLLPILHSTVGTLFFWLEDYQKAADHFEQFTLIGSAENTSYGSQASGVYRLARLYETKLGDSGRAAHFYRRLVLEYPNSNMMYYSMEKAVEAGMLSREEVRNLNLTGMTPELLDEIFAHVPGGDS